MRRSGPARPRRPAGLLTPAPPGVLPAAPPSTASSWSLPSYPSLPDRAQPLDALVAHGDRLAPPAGHLVLLVHVLGDLAMRPGVRRDSIERLHPALPRTPGLRFERSVAHAGELGVVSGGGGGDGRGTLPRGV